jgi:hypothetical protein
MPLAKRQTETADAIVGLPIYRVVKLIIKRRINAKESANHGAHGRKGLILRGFYRHIGACKSCKGGLPLARGHA